MTQTTEISKSEKTANVHMLFIVLAVIVFCSGAFGAVIMTDAGQLIDVPRDWVVWYSRFHWVFELVGAALLVVFIWINLKYRLWGNISILLFAMMFLMSVFAAHWMVPLIFPSYQYNATYSNVLEADPLVENDETVYVIEINGEIAAFPRRFIVFPHIIGAMIGGEYVVMTYCGLSNLPMVYGQFFKGKRLDLSVLSQVHNNLLMLDRKSGEIIQQIHGRMEFGGHKLTAYPNQMMNWRTFKVLYPEGKVFRFKLDRLLDRLMVKIFENDYKQFFNVESGPIFPTLDLIDKRLPNKEKIWGIDINGEQVAFSKSFLDQNPINSLTIGGQSLLVVYHRNFHTVGVFSREINGKVIDVKKIDVYGNTRHGRLERVPYYNGIFWMVWSHFFPETGLKT